MTTLTNCSTKNPNADNCLTCVAGFVLTPNKLKCIAEIVNCKTYNNTNNTSLVCTVCKDGFYLTNNTCAEGQIANCLTYAS